ncbi:MAG: SpoIIE family protein phosphatase [Candidatus Aminicenantes bacterium]|jgi:serine phosphatase RsbU (regulator of sigma subunit)/putative methionine-R-sulfoxide reductase with GAF domain
MDKELQFKKEFIDLYSELDLNSLLDKMADKICDYLGCEAASMFLYDSRKEELYFESATGEKQEELKKIVLKKGEGLVGWVAEHNEGVIVNDCSTDPRFTAVTDKKTNFITQSILAVPVQMNRKFLGVLEAVNKKQSGFDQHDQNLLESIASFISIPLQNAMLFKKVMTETQEKERLIELGKIVSCSFDLEEVFITLKDIITEIIKPLEINVMVKSQNRIYHLIPNKKTPYREAEAKKTTRDGKQAVFPLRVKNERLGYLEIKANKKIPDEIVNLIRGIAIFAAISIEKFEMHIQVLARERIEKELQIAKNIQRSFLPDERKIALKGMDVACLNIPSSEVGGDYYDIVPLSEDETIFTINDISGHGIPASLPMSIFSANFKYRVKKDKDMLTTINHLDNLLAETTDASQFVTSFTCCVNIKDRKLKYFNCGHNPPLLFRKDRIIELKEGEAPLGLFPDLPRTVATVNIEKNDLVILYTDGIIEAENPQGEQFDYHRLKNCLKTNQYLPAESIKEKLIRELKEFVNKDHFHDDVTLVIIEIE